MEKSKINKKIWINYMKTQQYKFKSIGDLNIKDKKKLQSNSSKL